MNQLICRTAWSVAGTHDQRRRSEQTFPAVRAPDVRIAPAGGQPCAADSHPRRRNRPIKAAPMLTKSTAPGAGMIAPPVVISTLSTITSVA